MIRFLVTLGKLRQRSHLNGRRSTLAVDSAHQDLQKENCVSLIEIGMLVLALFACKCRCASKNTALTTAVAFASLPDTLLQTFGSLDGEKHWKAFKSMALTGLNRAGEQGQADQEGSEP